MGATRGNKRPSAKSVPLKDTHAASPTPPKQSHRSNSDRSAGPTPPKQSHRSNGDPADANMFTAHMKRVSEYRRDKKMKITKLGGGNDNRRRRLAELRFSPDTSPAFQQLAEEILLQDAAL